MSKSNLIFSSFLLMSISFFAQKERIEYLPTIDKVKLHYGFYLGLNQNDFKLNFTDEQIPNPLGGFYEKPNITVESTAGFNVGLIADLRLHKNLNLRLEPGLMTNSKKIVFNHLTDTPNPRDSIRKVGSTYLHVPLLLKFSTDRYRNIRPYLLGGISYNYNFAAGEENQDDNSAGEFRMTTHNFMYELGFGLDFYLYYFKFSPSIRGLFAINNEVKYDDDAESRWTAPINFMGTRGLFLNFSFEN